MYTLQILIAVRLNSIASSLLTGLRNDWTEVRDKSFGNELPNE